jgi:hypothetical protein
MRASLPFYPPNHFSLTPRGGFIHTGLPRALPLVASVHPTEEISKSSLLDNFTTKLLPRMPLQEDLAKFESCVVNKVLPALRGVSYVHLAMSRRNGTSPPHR